MCDDPQPESCAWLFKPSFAGAGYIVAAPPQAAQLVEFSSFPIKYKLSIE